MLVRIPELVDEAHACRIIGGEHSPIHRSTLWRGVSSGRYPQPIKVGDRLTRWRVTELLAVLESAAQERSE